MVQFSQIAPDTKFARRETREQLARVENQCSYWYEIAIKQEVVAHVNITSQHTYVFHCYQNQTTATQWKHYRLYVLY